MYQKLEPNCDSMCGDCLMHNCVLRLLCGVFAAEFQRERVAFGRL